MTGYAFKTGRLEGDNGCKATLHEVSLDFGKSLAPDAGELLITGLAKRIDLQEGVLLETGQIYFKTTTSNFGIAQKVTIKLNNCRITGNTFEAMPDNHGKVFTLSVEEPA